jgi:hypothetical protein
MGTLNAGGTDFDAKWLQNVAAGVDEIWAVRTSRRGWLGAEKRTVVVSKLEIFRQLTRPFRRKEAEIAKKKFSKR